MAGNSPWQRASGAAKRAFVACAVLAIIALVVTVVTGLVLGLVAVLLFVLLGAWLVRGSARQRRPY